MPDRMAPQPALLVLVHYCGGSAGAVYNGNGRDFVTAADKCGYVIVLPEATRDGRCFDVSTQAGLICNGGSDSTGIMSMVAWTRRRYNVDPARIVVSGFSSGAMMTNVLAGCFATDGSLWNSRCAGGNVRRSAREWGDPARSMYPGHQGVGVSGTGHTLPQPGMLAYAVSFLGLDSGRTSGGSTCRM